MKFSFDGEPHELAALLRGLLASQGAFDVNAVLAPPEAPQAPQTLDGTRAFAHPETDPVGRFESLMEAFLTRPANERQTIVRFMFADPDVADLIVSAGGLGPLCEALDVTVPHPELFATDETPEPTLRHVIAVVYALAHIDGLMPEALKHDAIPTMTRTELAMRSAT
jgi:hypothetical protein